jgi:hypothetical protein
MLRQAFSKKDLTVGVAVLVGILFIYLSLPDSAALGDSRGSGRPAVHYKGAVFTGEQQKSGRGVRHLLLP